MNDEREKKKPSNTITTNNIARTGGCIGALIRSKRAKKRNRRLKRYTLVFFFQTDMVGTDDAYGGKNNTTIKTVIEEDPVGKRPPGRWKDWVNEKCKSSRPENRSEGSN